MPLASQCNGLLHTAQKCTKVGQRANVDFDRHSKQAGIGGWWNAYCSTSVEVHAMHGLGLYFFIEIPLFLCVFTICRGCTVNSTDRWLLETANWLFDRYVQRGMPYTRLHNPNIVWKSLPSHLLDSPGDIMFWLNSQSASIGLSPRTTSNLEIESEICVDNLLDIAHWVDICSARIDYSGKLFSSSVIIYSKCVSFDL